MIIIIQLLLWAFQWHVVAADTGNWSLKVFIGTWNVADNTASQSGDIKAWLQAVKPEIPDLYVIGLQEVAEGLCFWTSAKSSSSLGSTSWAKHVSDSLPQNGEYEQIKVWKQGCMQIMVFAKASILANVTDVSEAGINVPKLNPKKGAAVISLKYRGALVCFVNSHLPAHEEKASIRDTVIGTINRKIKISDHNMVIWLGDLNYRLKNNDISKNATEFRADVLRNIKSGTHRELLPFDELLHRKSTGDNTIPFHDYREKQIEFLPTYKFNKGTDTYDTSKKQRIPAWCDRILVKCDEVKIRFVIEKYQSVPSIKTSDHKPVYLYGVIKPPRPLVVQRENIFEDIQD